MKNPLRAVVFLAGAALTMPLFVQASTNGTSPDQATISAKVGHELRMLPYYGIFDDLSYRVDGNTVTLFGQVTWPTLKSDAVNVVKKIEGVQQVNNEIEVLPLSPFDDGIRLRELRAIYGYGPLQRYGLGALPSIHILVKNGNVTLAGVVANEADKNMAGLRANLVPGVFSVKNDLRVENKS